MHLIFIWQSASQQLLSSIKVLGNVSFVAKSAEIKSQQCETQFKNGYSNDDDDAFNNKNAFSVKRNNDDTEEISNVVKDTGDEKTKFYQKKGHK